MKTNSQKQHCPLPVLGGSYPLFFFAIAFALIFATGTALADDGNASNTLSTLLIRDILVYAHIAGGTVGILTGVVAIAAPKGKPVHRAAGKLFFISMFIAYLSATILAPMADSGQRPNFVGGVLALYLLITAWRTVKIPRINPGLIEHSGLIFAVGIVTAGLIFMQMGANDPTGTVDGSPPQAFILFATAGFFAAAGDFHLILSKGLSGAARIARHLWRMCFSFFIASTSLFLGQPQVFPDWFNASLVPVFLSFAPLIALVIWITIIGVEGLQRRMRRSRRKL